MFETALGMQNNQLQDFVAITANLLIVDSVQRQQRIFFLTKAEFLACSQRTFLYLKKMDGAQWNGTEGKRFFTVYFSLA